MFVIVEKEKEDTDKLFGTDSVILTKGIDFSNRPFASHPLNNPIKFVYTGNLIIGRDKTMALIADAINELNGDDLKVELDIYSKDVPDDTIMARLNRESSHHKGFIQRSDVDRVQREADVVVFAEALEGKSANIARLSFSTKITDYLANGKCILAVGKDYIAPIDYFIKNDSAIIATGAEQIKEKIKLIVDNPSIVAEYGQKAYDCAVRNHEKAEVDRRFINSMIKALNT
jgi:glycosyltransferase involved in cell wall biosynthesis